ncbi:MAG: hypothetical protein LWX83_09330 [Anaerolineae bacterium]|nr:hypothetical protein [Anaerolineae bacterium]
MNREISSLDWQRLSDYLDNQLSPLEISKLEDEINQRRDLNDAFVELKATRFLLHNLPRRRAPHNFTLTMRDIPARRFNFTWLPGLSFATVLSAIIFIFSLFYQPVLTNRSASQTLSISAVPMQAEAADKAAAEVNTQAAPMIFWGAPPMLATGKGGGGGGYGGGSGGGDGNAQMQVYAAPPVPAAPSENPESAAPALAAPAPEDTNNSGSVTAATALPQSAALTDSGPILGIRPTEQQGQEIPQAVALEPAAPVTPPLASNNVFYLFYIQIALGCLSLALAISTLIYWQRHK